MREAQLGCFDVELERVTLAAVLFEADAARVVARRVRTMALSAIHRATAGKARDAIAREMQSVIEPQRVGVLNEKIVHAKGGMAAREAAGDGAARRRRSKAGRDDLRASAC